MHNGLYIVYTGDVTMHPFLNVVGLHYSDLFLCNLPTFSYILYGSKYIRGINGTVYVCVQFISSCADCVCVNLQVVTS